MTAYGVLNAANRRELWPKGHEFHSTVSSAERRDENRMEIGQNRVYIRMVSDEITAAGVLRRNMAVHATLALLAISPRTVADRGGAPGI